MKKQMPKAKTVATKKVEPVVMKRDVKKDVKKPVTASHR
jgi:hypothetical protein